MIKVNFIILKFLVISGLIVVTTSISVYKEIANSLGYLEKYETHWKMWDMLMEVRDELDFGEEDCWEHAKHPPNYKGCEPMIQAADPVICPVD